MISTNKKITTAAATFGAALTSLYAATDLQADVVDLNVSGDIPVAFGNANSAIVDFINADIDFSQTVTIANDATYGRSIAGVSYGIGFLRLFDLSQQINSADFTNRDQSQTVTFSANAVGIQYVGFLQVDDDANTTNVGWFSVILAEDQSINIDTARFETTAGQSITIGGPASVPEPSGGALAALALGAIGLRRKRKS